MSTATAEPTTGTVLIVNRGEFLDALSLVAVVAKFRSNKPALQCVRIVIADGAVNVSGNSLDLRVSAPVTQIQIVRDADIAVKCEDLLDGAGRMTGDTVHLALNEHGGLVVSDEGSSFTLATVDPKEVPPHLAAEDGQTIEMKSDDLLRALKQVKWAKSDIPERYAITNIWIESEKGTAKFVTTDGRALAIASVEVASKDKFAGIMPIHILSLAERVASMGEDVMLTLSEHQFTVKAGDASASSSTIEGSFPPWRDVVPRDLDRKCIAKAGDMLARLNQVQWAARRKVKDAETFSARFEFEKGQPSTVIAKGDSAQATVQIPCTFDGGNLAIGLNAKWLREGVVASGAEGNQIITIEFLSANRPMLFTGGDQYQFVLMPVNLD